MQTMDLFQVTSKPQQRVLNYLLTGARLTHDMAKDRWGIARVASPIARLRARGYDIRTKRIKVKNKYGEEVWIGEYYIPRKAS